MQATESNSSAPADSPAIDLQGKTGSHPDHDHDPCHGLGPDLDPDPDPDLNLHSQISGTEERIRITVPTSATPDGHSPCICK